jgi:hypothetical protein
MRGNFYKCTLASLLMSLMGFATLQTADAVEYKFIGFGPGVAKAINNYGRVVGCGDSSGAAFLWEHGTRIALWRARANDINDLGKIVGQSANDLDYRVWRAILYDGGEILELTLGSAEGLINSGEVVGYLNHDHPSAFKYSIGEIIDLDNFGGPPYLVSIARDINNFGEVPGDNTQEGWLYNGGDRIFLGLITPLNSEGSSIRRQGKPITNSSQVIGWSNAHSGPNTSSWLYSGGKHISLDQLIPDDLKGIQTYDINQAGQIVGSGYGNDGGDAFPQTPIPEPSTILLLGSGIIGLAGIRRKFGKR